MTPLLELRGITKAYRGVTAVKDFDLSVAEGELVSIIGPNGAGKTTSFNLISGLDRPDAGSILFDGLSIGGIGPEAIAATRLYQTLLTKVAPPGVSGFNWMESMASFTQGRAAMWIDADGWAPPLEDPAASRVVVRAREPRSTRGRPPTPASAERPSRALSSG